MELRYAFGTFLQRTGKQDDARQELLVWQEKQRLRTQLSELSRRAVREFRDAEVCDQLAIVCRQR